jgi:hypothetical protein
MSIIMKNIGGYRRAHYITRDEADKMVADGAAVQHTGYDIFEQTSEEYQVKVMQPKRSSRKKVDQETTEGEA